MSSGQKARPQCLHAEKGRYMHVDPLSEVYWHVDKDYTQKRAGIGTWIHVLRRRGISTVPTHRRRPVRACGSTSSGVHARTQGLHSEKGRNQHGNIRPEAYKHVHRTYTPKRAEQARGSSSRGVQKRAQALHTEEGRYRHVDPRAGKYRPV